MGKNLSAATKTAVNEAFANLKKHEVEVRTFVDHVGVYVQTSNAGSGQVSTDDLQSAYKNYGVHSSKLKKRVGQTVSILQTLAEIVAEAARQTKDTTSTIPLSM